MNIKKKLACTALTLCALLATTAHGAAPSQDAMNEANNPLTPKITVNFHDYYQNLYNVDDDANSFLLRGVMPMKLGGAVQILRATLPVNTVPSAGGGQVTNVGDLNIVDFFPKKLGGMEVGIGPQITIPTAFDRETGTGKWQAGLGGLLIKTETWGMLGALAIWQTSFAGPSDRATQNNATIQPLLLYNLPSGFYIRSTAVMNFQLNYNHNYSIPVGLGAGRVITLENGTTINLFVEPQWTIAHHGAGVPQFQLFVGCNFQFPLHISKNNNI